MKGKLFSIMVLLMLISTVSFAQRGGGNGGGGFQRPDPKVAATERANEWQEKFGLSDDQHKKVYDILLATNEAQTKKMQEIRESGNMDREAMRKAITDLQEDQDKKLKAVFSADQWTAYETWKKDNPPMQRRRGGGN